MDADLLYQILLFFPIFLFSLTIHEYAHAITANWAGDLTATYQDRLTLNPIHHIDLFGTIIIPMMMIVFSGGLALFGWARPVPVDESRFKDKTWNVAITLAGPFSNLLLIIFGGLLLSACLNFYIHGAVVGWWGFDEGFVDAYNQFAIAFIRLNWILVIFNLLPIPPLDGSHLFYHFFIRGRGKFYEAWETYRRFGFIILLLAINMCGVIFVILQPLILVTFDLSFYPFNFR